MRITVLHATVLLSALAFTLSTLLPVSLGWRLFQLYFPLLLSWAVTLQLPTFLVLLVLVVLMGFFLPTIVGGAPLYSSGKAACYAVSQFLVANKNLRFLDVGSGTGGVILTLSSCHPDISIVGVESAWIPWLISKIRIALQRSHASVIYDNYQNINFGHYDIVYTYLTPTVMPGIWKKAKNEMKAHSLLLSYEFAIPGAEPDYCSYPGAEGTPLFGWRIPDANRSL